MPAEVVLDVFEVPDGGAKIISVDERLKIAVFRVGDRVTAINNRCPHAGASLGEGPFDGTTVKCPLHGFRVDVWRGIGNAGKRVEIFATTVLNGKIHINVPD